MPRYLRNSRYNRIFLLIGIGALIFISFQLLSFKVLNSSAQKRAQNAINEFEDNGDDEVDDDSDLDKPSQFDKKRQREQKAPEHLNLDPVVDVRGVNPEDIELYHPDSNKLFTCLQSKKKIPFTEVNDDYCDCDDNTDEPGTSACDGKFYCKKQIPHQALIVLPSNRVNDGICDCCDGSDEWKKTPPPNGVIPANRAKLSVKYAPCEDLCDKLIQTNKEDEKIQKMGKRLQLPYIIAAKHLPQKNDYGPEGIFYKLSLTCFTYKTKEYEYQVCPFQKITQDHFPGTAFSLGKVSTWTSRKNGRYLLRMEGGDTHLCPDGIGRMSVVTFLCGLNDRVIILQEDEKCVYGIKFSTPAAC
ncbi:glucosidase 2 subunit beta-like [Mytilus trossulus]|uniref:glucosidase 2 subunit beta-like n=1 Tax=Mytilus trossulus TaxID=6551 RepID=UPI0030075FB6